MTAKRSWSYHEGDRYEYFVTYIMSAIASIVPVPRQEDYGLDHVGFLTRQEGNLLYAEDAFSIQVKPEGGVSSLAFGGLKNGNWQVDQLNWLFGQSYPMLVARVNRTDWTLNLYSTAPMWQVKPFAGNPFQVTLEMDSPVGKLDAWKKPVKAHVEGVRPDWSAGGSWTVSLGAPIVSLKDSDLHDAAFRRRIYGVLKFWLTLDQRNIRHRAQNIPCAELPRSWETNEVPALRDYVAWWYSNATPGFHQLPVMQTLTPMVISLALNMDEQRDARIDRLQGIFSLLDSNNLIPGDIRARFKQLLERNDSLPKSPSPPAPSGGETTPLAEGDAHGR